MRMTTTILGTACLLLAATVPAAAGLPADAVQRASDAFAKINELALATRPQGRMPQLSQPAEKPVLEAMWDRSALIGAPPYDAKDVGGLLKIVELETTVAKSYALFKTDEAKPPDQKANAEKYQDEYLRTEAFAARASAAGIAGLDDFVDRLASGALSDERRQNMAQIRFGLLAMVNGLTLDLAAPVSAANKAMIAQTLADTGPAYALGTAPADRKVLADQVRAAMPSLDGATKARLATFVHAMDTPVCDRLCSIN